MTPMLILAAAALATGLPQTRVAATVQATATIRVLRAVVLKLDGSPNADVPGPRETVVTAADGSRQQLKVIEFQ